MLINKYSFRGNTIVTQIRSNYFKETKSYKYKRHFSDNTENIIYYSLYKIEYMYLVNKVKTNKFKIYEIDYLDNDVKIVYMRLLDSNVLRKVRIPSLDLYYETKDVYHYKTLYIWKTKNGVRKVYSFGKIYNRHEHRYYEVGDINKYGHILVKITSENVYSHSYQALKEVGLKIN